MLSPGVVEEIRRLLAAGQWSLRKIARELGVSRGTVSAIAHGKRQEPLPRAPDDDLLFAPIGPLRRCPGCGGLVHLPCLLCRVRQWQAAANRKRVNRPEGLLQLELVGEHQARYERVRARKLRGIARGEVPP